MTYKRDQRRAWLRRHRALWYPTEMDYARTSTQGRLPRSHAAAVAPHPMAGTSPAPRLRLIHPLHIIDETVDWVRKSLPRS